MPLRISGVALEQGALALALVGCLFVFFTTKNVRDLVKFAMASPVGYASVFVFVIWCVTAFFSIDVLGSLKIGGRTALFLLLSVLVWAVLICHTGRHQLLWKTLIISSLACATMALIAMNGFSELASIIKGNGFLRNSPYVILKPFSASLLCLIPVVAWCGRNLGGCWRWFGYALAPLALVIIVQTSNRAALAGYIVMAFTGVVLVSITNRQHVKAIFSATAAGISAGFAWLYFHEIGRPPIEGMYLPEWLIDPHRQQIWKFAFHRFLEKPWFGNGIDQLNKLPGANLHVPGLDASAAFIPSHPHSWVMEILAETGVVGFLPVVFTLGFLAIRLIKRYLKDGNDGDLTLLILMSGFWASALFNFSIWAVWWQLTFFVLFAIIASARNPKTLSETP